MSAKRYQTVPEWAAELGISTKAAYAHLHRHRVPVVRLGRRVWVDRAEWERRQREQRQVEEISVA